MTNPSTTSFGRMSAHVFPGNKLMEFLEVLHFEKPGKPHRHNYEEIAVCVSGSGLVSVDGIALPVVEGDSVEISEGVSHFMVPDPGVTLVMVILYRKPK